MPDTAPLTLLEVCSFCFEKVEVIGGYSQRYVPCRTPELARDAFERWLAEAQRLYGEPTRTEAGDALGAVFGEGGALRISVAGCLVIVDVRGRMSRWPTDADWQHVDDASQDALERLWPRRW